MSNKIKFIAKDQYGWEVHPRPIPAAASLPEWLRAMQPYDLDHINTNGKRITVENRVANASPKKCVPMLDAMTAGYLIPLWADVIVHQENGSPVINWRVSEDVFSLHGDSARDVGRPEGYNPAVFKFHNTWRPVTPPGYSVLVTQPAGRTDSPFYAVSAIIDTDKSTTEIVPPLWIREGFEGVIEKGTPIVQVIPFKRENWEAEFSVMGPNEYRHLEDRNFGSNLVNHYARNVWQKKKFK